jgi:hypothetical protein
MEQKADSQAVCVGSKMTDAQATLRGLACRAVRATAV